MPVDVVVAGSTGLVGRALMKRLEMGSYSFIGLSSKEVDLRDRIATFAVLKSFSPKIVIDAAARVGGINYNNNFPVEFLLDNLRIQNNLMEASHEIGVEKFVFLGSSCIYPRLAKQPIREDYLMTGLLEQTNSAYAIAKIAGIELISAYRKEYGHKWISLMPTNIYGPYDNFNLNRSHVVPALIRKFVEAKQSNSSEVEIWGTGLPRREFLFSEDLADAILFCVDNYDGSDHLNVGYGSDVSIKDLANLLSSIINFTGSIFFNSEYPDGTPQKLLDSSRLNNLGWKPRFSLEDGLRRTVNWYLRHPEELRI